MHGMKLAPATAAAGGPLLAHCLDLQCEYEGRSSLERRKRTASFSHPLKSASSWLVSFLIFHLPHFDCSTLAPA